MNKEIKNLLQNKIVLYILLIIAITNLFGYLLSENYAAIFIFLVIGYLTTYFTENMIIVFGLSVIVTNFIIAVNSQRIKENFEKNKNKKDEKKKKLIKETGIATSEKPTTKTSINGNGNVTSNVTTKDAIDDTLSENPSKKVDNDSEKIQGVCSGPSCKNSKQKMNSANIEDTLDLVQNLIGKDGLKDIDPVKLEAQRKNLEQTINQIGPMVDKVEGMMNKLGGTKMLNMIGGLAEMIKK